MSSFNRDRFTWLAYLMLGYYAYQQSAVGPLMPFLRSELSLSYTAGGLHLSAFAAGLVVSGLLTDRLARRWGRRWTFWGGVTGMVTGGILLTLGRQVQVTVLSNFIMGLFGSMLLVTIQAGLSDRHGDRRAIALTESNISASVCAMLAPVAVGGLQQAGVGWRGALWLGVGLVVLLAAVRWRTQIPTIRISTEGAPPAGRQLPATFWAYWGVIVLCVAAEWCLAFWAADFLAGVVGLPKNAASTAVSVFFMAMIAGRVIGSRLARSVPTGLLLLAALAIAAAGFPMFWLGRAPALNLVGLFVTGLGVANLFPMAMTTATGVAALRIDTASARVSMGSGLAIFSAPLLLGGVADRVGIQDAFGLVLVLLAAAGGVAVWAYRFSARRATVLV